MADANTKKAQGLQSYIRSNPGSAKLQGQNVKLQGENAHLGEMKAVRASTPVHPRKSLNGHLTGTLETPTQKSYGCQHPDAEAPHKSRYKT